MMSRPAWKSTSASGVWFSSLVAGPGIATRSSSRRARRWREGRCATIQHERAVRILISTSEGDATWPWREVNRIFPGVGGGLRVNLRSNNTRCVCEDSEPIERTARRLGRRRRAVSE